MIRLQICKHNGRRLRGISLRRSVFGEQRTGVLFAKLIEVQDPTPDQPKHYISNIHETTIDLSHLYLFSKEEAPLNEINLIKSSSAYDFHKDHITPIIGGTDI